MTAPGTAPADRPRTLAATAAALALALLAAGCESSPTATAAGPGATSSPAAPSASPSPAAAAGSAIDGTWTAHVDWARVRPAGCPVAAPGETTADFRMTLDGGRMRIYVSTNLAPQPSLGSQSHYQVFRDRIEIEDEQPSTARITRDGDTLTFTDMKGGGCDGQTVMTTVPWHRVQG